MTSFSLEGRLEFRIVVEAQKGFKFLLFWTFCSSHITGHLHTVGNELGNE